MVDQNFDKFSKADRINLSIKLLGTADQMMPGRYRSQRATTTIN